MSPVTQDLKKFGWPKSYTESAREYMSSFESESPLAVRWVVVLVGLAMAVIVGVAIGSGDILLGFGPMLVGGTIVYLLIVRNLTWQIALLFCFLDFYFQPVGFRFGALELGCMLGYALVIAHIWQKSADTTHPFFRTAHFGFSGWLFHFG